MSGITSVSLSGANTFRSDQQRAGGPPQLAPGSGVQSLIETRKKSMSQTSDQGLGKMPGSWLLGALGTALVGGAVVLAGRARLPVQLRHKLETLGLPGPRNRSFGDNSCAARAAYCAWSIAHRRGLADAPPAPAQFLERLREWVVGVDGRGSFAGHTGDGEAHPAFGVLKAIAHQSRLEHLDSGWINLMNSSVIPNSIQVVQKPLGLAAALRALRDGAVGVLTTKGQGGDLHDLTILKAQVSQEFLEALENAAHADTQVAVTDDRLPGELSGTLSRISPGKLPDGSIGQLDVYDSSTGETGTRDLLTLLREQPAMRIQALESTPKASYEHAQGK